MFVPPRRPLKSLPVSVTRQPRRRRGEDADPQPGSARAPCSIKHLIFLPTITIISDCSNSGQASKNINTQREPVLTQWKQSVCDTGSPLLYMFRKQRFCHFSCLKCLESLYLGILMTARQSLERQQLPGSVTNGGLGEHRGARSGVGDSECPQRDGYALAPG